MAAYIYANIEITDVGLYEQYRREVPAVIAAYGGRYLARGGQAELLEGDADMQRQVILEFANMAALKAFYDSPEYRALRALRQRAGKGSLVAVEGV